MKIIFIHRWLRPDDGLKARVQTRLAQLASVLRIEVAEVALERNQSSSPAYVARVHLAVPGPDIHLEERDHTIEATVGKLLDRLSRLARDRKRRLLARRRLEPEPV
ncbi:MAG: HPF/RaiA family ribosome-associated protein [Verrucomicrobia bacterium]|nr:HPF/RaiA family ribosome-associated protein [Verrucomicrobiota bacterium]